MITKDPALTSTRSLPISNCPWPENTMLICGSSWKWVDRVGLCRPNQSDNSIPIGWYMRRYAHLDVVQFDFIPPALACDGSILNRRHKPNGKRSATGRTVVWSGTADLNQLRRFAPAGNDS